jgi:glucose/arabinose dehydrogenase/cytochrome c553
LQAISAARLATSIGLAGFLVATATVSLQAQQAADPPPWKQGMSPAASSSTLAPVAPPPLPTAADKLPLDKLKARTRSQDRGLCGRRSQRPDAATRRQGDRLRLEPRAGQGARARHQGRQARDEGRRLRPASAQRHRPAQGHALHRRAQPDLEDRQHRGQSRQPPKPTVILADLPKDEPHGWKYLTVGPDEKLYFQVGVPCNICLPSDRHGRIYRVGLDGKDLEVYAYGIRQIVGMDWHPTLKQLYFSENARDWLSEDIPEDKLNRVTQPGKDHFGYPYCHQGNFTDPELGWGRSCEEFTKPVALVGPHSAALGLKFYTGDGLGTEYRNVLFMARHGSWNRSVKIGGDVVTIRLNDDGTFRSMEPFHHRLHPEQQLCRPAGGRPADAGRRAARLRRLQRCRLSRQSEMKSARRRLAVLILLCGWAPLAGAQSITERLAPCYSCHGDQGQSFNPDTPSLGAQPSPYLLIQLYLFREKLRTVELMNAAMKGFTDDDLRAFADTSGKAAAAAG